MKNQPAPELHKLAYAILGLVGFSLLGCGTPLGERTVEVKLLYQGDSDAGPEDATGTATINTSTGLVDIEVQGLIIDTSKDQLEGWLAGGGESPLSTSHFSPDGTGAPVPSGLK